MALGRFRASFWTSEGCFPEGFLAQAAHVHHHVGGGAVDLLGDLGAIRAEGDVRGDGMAIIENI